MKAKPIEIPSPHHQQRFWKLVEKSNGCWEWKGWCTHGGYGSFQINKKNYVAHRLSWRILRGEIGAGLSLGFTYLIPSSTNFPQLSS